ncbi:MAG TPA: bifunctional nuclease domain-containing protein, partial [Chloroflexota bacterium]|nr:bifunctional nuclease domain-containing protein [Chloroflexota bacterium]
LDAALEEVTVDSIRMNLMVPNRVVMLKAKQRERYLPIIIGVPEADAIAIKLQGKEIPRPLTHDLMLAGFTRLDTRVERVVVSDWQGDTFYGQIHLRRTGLSGRPEPPERDGLDTVLDARPSDCIALAVRAGAPVYVAAAVLERCGVDTLTPPAQFQGDFPPTERARTVLGLTRKEMVRFGRDELTSDLLLLAILAEGKSHAARLLTEAGVHAAPGRAAVAALSGFGDAQPPDDRLPEIAGPAFRALAEDAARELGNRFIGTEHLLLAMLAEQDGPARRVLDHLNVNATSLRQRLLDAPRTEEQPARPHSP